MRGCTAKPCKNFGKTLGTEITDELRNLVAHSLGVHEEHVHCTLDGDVVVVTVTGEIYGRSARNATRRRQEASRVAKRTAASRNLLVSITFAMRDAVSLMEDSIRTAAAFVLGHPPESTSVNVGRTGKTSVLVAVEKVEDSAKAQLTHVIAALLRGAGLSLSDLSLVSPMREDVSDARVLRAAKITAPCDGAAVARRLKQADGVDIAADVVHRRLDFLRQRGLLVYLGDRRFALTLKGLGSVPTSANRRDSSDVERVLALARSKW